MASKLARGKATAPTGSGSSRSPGEPNRRAWTSDATASRAPSSSRASRAALSEARVEVAEVATSPGGLHLNTATGTNIASLSVESSPRSLGSLATASDRLCGCGACVFGCRVIDGGAWSVVVYCCSGGVALVAECAPPACLHHVLQRALHRGQLRRVGRLVDLGRVVEHVLGWRRGHDDTSETRNVLVGPKLETFWQVAQRAPLVG